MKTAALLIAATLSVIPMTATSDAAVYDPITGNLTMPLVTVGSTTFANVVINLQGFTVLAATPVGAACDKATNITYSRWQAIMPNMTLGQVTLILGCDYNATLTNVRGSIATLQWVTPAFDKWIGVNLDVNTLEVISPERAREELGSGHSYKCGSNIIGAEC